MQNLPKLMLVFAVLVTGMVAALPFQRRNRSTGKIVNTAPEDLVLRRQVNLQITPDSVGAAVPLRIKPPPEPGFTQPARIRAGHGDDEVPLSRRAPPELSDRFTRLEEETTVPAGRQAAPFTASTSGKTTMVRHRIVDGDNLPDLAQRYLGDRQRSHELYQLNRDVLQSPDLLPIGCVIKIPFRSN